MELRQAWGLGIGALVVIILVVSAFVIGFVVGRETNEKEAQVSDSQFGDAEETHGQKTTAGLPPTPKRTSSGSGISLEGPGDRTTPPTFFTKDKLLVAELTHDVPEGTSGTLGGFSENNLVVSVRNSEGNIVPGGHIWEVGDYSGFRSVTIPEDGYYTIEVEGASPWSMDVTLFPDG